MNAKNTYHRIECTTWHRPYLYIGKDSVGAKCRSCNDIHSVSRAQLEHIWEEMDEDEEDIGIVTVVKDSKGR